MPPTIGRLSNKKPHRDRRCVPAARGEPPEQGSRRFLFIEMKWLWIELAGELFDLRDAGLVRDRSKDLADVQILQEEVCSLIGALRPLGFGGKIAGDGIGAILRRHGWLLRLKLRRSGHAHSFVGEGADEAWREYAKSWGSSCCEPHGVIRIVCLEIWI